MPEVQVGELRDNALDGSIGREEPKLRLYSHVENGGTSRDLVGSRQETRRDAGIVVQFMRKVPKSSPISSQEGHSQREEDAAYSWRCRDVVGAVDAGARKYR